MSHQHDNKIGNWLKAKTPKKERVYYVPYYVAMPAIRSDYKCPDSGIINLKEMKEVVGIKIIMKDVGMYDQRRCHCQRGGRTVYY